MTTCIALAVALNMNTAQPEWFDNLVAGQKFGSRAMTPLEADNQNSRPGATNYLAGRDWVVRIYGETPWMVEFGYLPDKEFDSPRDLVSACFGSMSGGSFRTANPFSTETPFLGEISRLNMLPSGWRAFANDKYSVILLSPEVCGLLRSNRIDGLTTFAEKTSLAKLAGKNLAEVSDALGAPAIAVPIYSRNHGLAFHYFLRGTAHTLWVWVDMPTDAKSPNEAKAALLNSTSLELVFQFDSQRSRIVEYNPDAQFGYEINKANFASLMAELGATTNGVTYNNDGAADNEFYVRGIPGIPDGFGVSVLPFQLRVGRSN